MKFSLRLFFQGKKSFQFLRIFFEGTKGQWNGFFTKTCPGFFKDQRSNIYGFFKTTCPESFMNILHHFGPIGQKA